MGVISIVGKIVIVATNIALLLISLILIIIGVIIVSGKDVYNSLLSELKDELKTATSQLGTTVDTSDFSLTDLMLPLAYACIIIGIVIGALSLIGCIGGCYTIKIILIVYAIVLGALFLVQVIIVALVYADQSTLDSTVKPYLKDTLDDYAGIEGSDAKSLAWNSLMNYEGCCGIDDYTDFNNLTKWPATIGGNTYALITPVICCKNKTDANTGTYACAITPTDTNNYWKTGCYDKLFDLILGSAMVITVIILMIAAQFVLLFFTIWILCTMDNKIDII